MMISTKIPVCCCLSMRSINKIKPVLPKYYFYSAVWAPNLGSINLSPSPISKHYSNLARHSYCKVYVSSSDYFLFTNKDFYSSGATKFPGKNADKKEIDERIKSPKSKKEVKVYITLLNVDKSMTVSTVDEAKKIAERRNLKLVKVNELDTKSGRALYKLVTEAQYLKDDSGWANPKSTRDKFIKGDKLVSLSSNTNEHDVLTKAKMMKKWLSKKLEVRVVISGNVSAGENVFSIVEKEIGTDGRIVQKRVKGQDIRFQIVPPKKVEEKSKTSPESEEGIS